MRKSLAKYYHKWYRDCHESAIYCMEKGDNLKASEYLSNARKYFDIIINNWDAIEFFSVGDNAFIRRNCLPERYQGHE